MMHHEQESRRMRAAGYERVRVGAMSGWVKKAFAAHVLAEIQHYAEHAKRILSQPAKPRGWQKGKPRKSLD